jgi:uncharacterized protein (TIGR04255 family)
MEKASLKTHFPSDIKLKNSPLAEAWLEIRWHLDPIDPPQFMTDQGYPFILGPFYNSIKDRFPNKEELDASKAPQDFLPHVVRHRFRVSPDGWPILQLGPGVASVNFTPPYTWKEFRETALYLRSNLSDAYSEWRLDSQLITLRYRNVEPFPYSQKNFLNFLEDNLNTTISLPSKIPGYAGSTSNPTSANIVLTYDLTVPKGTGTLRLSTGVRTEKDPKTDEERTTEILMWQLEVSSGENNAPEIVIGKDFANWLDAGHSVIHEWFFSMIEGSLRKTYESEGS